MENEKLNFKEAKKSLEKLRKSINKKDSDIISKDDLLIIVYSLYGKLPEQELKILYDEYSPEIHYLEILEIVKGKKIKSKEKKESDRALIPFFVNKFIYFWIGIRIFIYGLICLSAAILFLYSIISYQLYLIFGSLSLWIIFNLLLNIYKEDWVNIGKDKKLTSQYKSYILTKIVVALFLFILALLSFFTKDHPINSGYYIAIASILAFSITTSITLFTHERRVFISAYENRKTNIISSIKYLLDGDRNKELLEFYEDVLKTIQLLEPSQENFSWLKKIGFKIMLDQSLIKNDELKDKFNWKLKVDIFEFDNDELKLKNNK